MADTSAERTGVQLNWTPTDLHRTAPVLAGEGANYARLDTAQEIVRQLAGGMQVGPSRRRVPALTVRAPELMPARPSVADPLRGQALRFRPDTFGVHLPEFVASFASDEAWQHFLTLDRENQLDRALRYFGATNNVDAISWCSAGRSLGRLRRFLGDPTEQRTSFYFPTLDECSQLTEARFRDGVPIALARYASRVALDWLPAPEAGEDGADAQAIVRIGRFVVANQLQMAPEIGVIGSSYVFQKLC